MNRLPNRSKATENKSRDSNGKAWRSPEQAINWLARKTGGKVSGPWIYNSRDGRCELMRVYRFDYENGDKDCKPMHRDAAGWRFRGPPGKTAVVPPG